MRYLIAVIFSSLFVPTSDSFGQEIKVNFIIQLNDQLVIGDIAALRLYIETDRDRFSFDLGYWPGDLILPERATAILAQDTIKSVTLMFNLYSYKGDKQTILNVKTPFSKSLLEQRFVILNVYDLRNRIYKRQLGHLTQDNYVCEYIIPNGGRLIRRK